MSLEAWLLSDELVVPLMMIMMGALSIAFHVFLKKFFLNNEVSRKPHASHFHLESIRERFDQRQKISWLVTLVGVLWLSLGFVADVIARGP